MRIEVVADETAPEGGRAKILLHGVWGLPPDPAFRIQSLDMSRGIDPLDWPHGDRSPLETRQSSQGIELIIGAEIIDAPALAPGTPVRIVVPAIDLEQELFWPSLPATPANSAMGPVLASIDDLVAAAAARETAFAEAAAAREALTAKLAMSPAGARGTDAPPFSAASARERGSLAGRLLLPTASAPSHAGDSSSPRFSRGATLNAFAAGALTSLLLIGAGALALKVSPMAGRMSPAPMGSAAHTPLPDVLAVGDVSPRGRKAEGVDFETLVGLADLRLRGNEGSADREEARYWLRRALVEAVGSERLLWTMTQLGTSYANGSGPSREADLHKARALWEISGALGDHVASCFLAIVHENALGTAKDGVAAGRYREAARAGGSCPQLQSAANGEQVVFVDPRRLPAGSTSPDAAAAEERQWARERQEVKRALSDTLVQRKLDADKLAAMEANLKRKEDETARLIAHLDAREKDAQGWSAGQADLRRMFEDAQQQQARLTVELAGERERRALSEAQLAKPNEKEAFDAALTTARRLAAEAAAQGKSGGKPAPPGQ